LYLCEWFFQQNNVSSHNMMLKKVKQHITDNQLFGERDKVLLAVSGGPDSVAMAHMLSRLHVKIGICHVNFHLRGKDSDGDEQFVRDMAQRLGAEIFVLEADTEKFAKDNGLSIEMAARDIRYAEFQRIMDQHGYACTAVAHHQDDAIETFVLNLTRGAGIKGLTGIKVRNQRIVRPLLCLTRQEIMQYIEQQHLPYRTDKTNLESNYARNKVRNLIMPILEQINPSAKNSISESLRYLAMAKHIYEQDIEKAMAKTISKTKQNTTISIPQLLRYTEPECLLYEIICQYGFGKYQCANILRGIEGESGRVYESKTHRLIKDREHLIIEETASKAQTRQQIQIEELKPGHNISTPHHTLCISKIKPEDFCPERDAGTIYLDFDKLNAMDLPLEITGWQPGDQMTVFGGKRKKLSDIFVDSKLSISQKENVEILRYGSKILWAIGIRASNLCAVNKSTTNILKITAK